MPERFNRIMPRLRRIDSWRALPALAGQPKGCKRGGVLILTLQRHKAVTVRSPNGITACSHEVWNAGTPNVRTSQPHNASRRQVPIRDGSSSNGGVVTGQPEPTPGDVADEVRSNRGTSDARSTRRGEQT